METSISASEKAVKRRIEIHRITESCDLSPEAMYLEASSVTPEANEQRAALQSLGIMEGAIVKSLFSDPVSNVSLTYAWFKANFRVSPHSHSADCTYYIVSGTARLGTEVLRAGDVFFVPSGAIYSYDVGADGLEVLEFRTATRFDISYPKASKAAYERSAAMIKENIAMWRHQKAPPAAQRILDPSA